MTKGKSGYGWQCWRWHESQCRLEWPLGWLLWAEEWMKWTFRFPFAPEFLPPDIVCWGRLLVAFFLFPTLVNGQRTHQKEDRHLSQPIVIKEMFPWTPQPVGFVDLRRRPRVEPNLNTEFESSHQVAGKLYHNHLNLGTLNQGFSTSALSTFGTRAFLVVGWGHEVSHPTWEALHQMDRSPSTVLSQSMLHAKVPHWTFSWIANSG